MFITGAFLILAYCADKHGSQNFQEIIREVLGPGAYIVTQIVVMLYMFGSTVAYMILIGDQLEKGKQSFSFCILSFCLYSVCHRGFQQGDVQGDYGCPSKNVTFFLRADLDGTTLSHATSVARTARVM